MIKLSDFKCPEINNLIAMAMFGSYGTEFWINNKSDIDILVLLEYRIDASTEFKIEDTLIPLLEDHFNYKNIHLTFIYMNEFASPFAKHYIESNDKLIIDSLKEIDFRLYVNKYIRENQWIQNIIDRDMKLLRGN
ncbi:MAG: nucleotidyltransferase domain-containing protein [Clostridium sp.]|nr:nucleotidyltransferase domain-containing protein [Clostridium sp.]